MSEEKKIWRVYKKAWTIINFATNIIPKFVNSNSLKNTLGTWSCSLVEFDGATTNAWEAFDGSTTTSHIQTTNLRDATKHAFIYLNLPAGVTISLNKCRLYYYQGGGVSQGRYVRIQGFDEETSSWVNITNNVSFPGSSNAISGSRDITTISTNFFNKFRLEEWNSKYQDKTSTMKIYELQFIEDTLRY